MLSSLVQVSLFVASVVQATVLQGSALLFSLLVPRPIVAIVALGALLFAGVMARYHFKQRALRAQGYRRVDIFAQVFQHIGTKYPTQVPSVTAMQVCSDKFTVTQVRELWQRVAEEFINFRSSLHKLDDNQWYYKELPLDQLDVASRVKYVEMNEEDTNDIFDVSDDPKEVSERALQRGVAYMNSVGLCVPYAPEEPSWDVHYLHFKKSGRCMMFARVSHVLVDGIAMGMLVQDILHKMYGAYRYAEGVTQKPDYHRVMAELKKRYNTWGNWLYFFRSIPAAFQLIAADGQRLQQELPHCSLWQLRSGKTNMAVSRAIPMADFKRVAKSMHATINELFMLINSRVIRKAMQSRKDPMLDDSSWSGRFRCISVASTRPKTAEGLDRSFSQLAKEGTNGNALNCLVFDLPVKGSVTVESVRAIWNPLKFGYYPVLYRQIFELAAALGVCGRLYDETEHKEMSVFSNVVGPSAPLPIPVEGETIDVAFGMGQGTWNMCFTLLSYASDLRLGLYADEASLKDPNELIHSFVAEYEAMKASLDQ